MRGLPTQPPREGGDAWRRPGGLLKPPRVRAAGPPLRRALIALLFFLAPFDISKAVIAPLASTYHPTGPYYSPGLYVSLAEMALLALGAVWVLRRLLVERRLLPLTPVDALAFAYAAWIWVSALGAEQGVLALGSAAAYTFAVLCFYVVSHNLADRDDMRLALRAVLWGLAFQVVYVAAQAATKSALPLPGSKGMAVGSLVELGSGGQAFRPPGTFNHPNALAHYLIVLLPPLLALALLGRGALAPRLRRIVLMALAAGFAALMATLSRGGWLAFIVSAAMVVAVYWRRGLLSNRQIGRGLAGVVLGAVLLVAAQPNILLRLTAPDSRSLESRTLLADMAWTIIKAHPLLGVGYGDYNRAAYSFIAPMWADVSLDYQVALHQLVVHNHFLLIAAELGVPAMLFFVYLLWRFVRLPWPLLRWQDPGRFALAIGLAAGLLGQMLFLNSDNYYADIRVFLLWMSAGVLQALCLQSPVPCQRAAYRRTRGMGGLKGAR